MLKHSLLYYKYHRLYLLCTIILILFFSYSPQFFSQNEGVSVHGDFLSGVFSYGFNKPDVHPGNFLLGGQYNLPIVSVFELNGGFDFLWVELYGKINSVNRQAEVFIPFIFGGAALNFDQWRLFGKIGVSLDESINILGSRQGWVSSILSNYMGYCQFGIKCPLDNALSVSTSVGYYFGDKIKIDNTPLTFATVNLGFSYNLFSPAVVPQGVDEYKDKYYVIQSENAKLNRKVLDLQDSIKSMQLKTPAVVNIEPIPVVVPVVIPARSISVDSINRVYNLHLREALNLKDFVNKKGLKEEGELILEEYNSIAASFKGFESGIYLICTVSDIKTFKKNESEFSRIKFQSNPSVKNKLIMDIDVSLTEKNNNIKLKIK
jgi:hypothetical protein